MKLKNTLGLAISALIMDAAMAEQPVARKMSDKDKEKLLGAWLNMKEAEVVTNPPVPYKMTDMNGDMGVIQNVR
jgi:hypothetical protein